MSEPEVPSRVAPTRSFAIRSFIRHHWLIIAVGFIALVYSALFYSSDFGSGDPLSTRNMVQIVLIGSFFLLLVFGHHPKYQILKVATSALVPITVILILIYIWLDAKSADNLTLEDRVIEDFSFLFLMVGAACMALVALVVAKRREWWTMVLAGLGALAFFVIGMEEVSWFQRVLEIESGEFFLERNAQNETNFHNMYTHESEDTYYMAGFLLLVVFPYFRVPLGRLLRNLGLASARILLPAYWLITPFVLAGAFVSQDFANRAANIAIVLGSIMILLGLINREYRQQRWWACGQAIVTLVLMLAAITLLISIDREGLGVRPWFGKEYQEFYIAWGIAAYATSVLFNTLRHRDEPAALQGSEGT